MLRRELYSVVTCLALLTICAQSSHADDQSRVFVYAHWGMPPKSWTPVSCDGEKMAEIKQGFFFAINLSPGRHVLSLKDGVPVPIDVHAGTDVFVTLGQHQEWNQSPVLVLSTVDEETATKGLRFASYIEKKRIHSDTVPKSDPRPPAVPQLRIRQPQ